MGSRSYRLRRGTKKYYRPESSVSSLAVTLTVHTNKQKLSKGRRCPYQLLSKLSEVLVKKVLNNLFRIDPVRGSNRTRVRHLKVDREMKTEEDLRFCTGPPLSPPSDHQRDIPGGHLLKIPRAVTNLSMA